MTGREFYPTQADGPIRRLSTGRLKVTDHGINVVERHIGRFGKDEANQVMVHRLRRVAAGDLESTQYDLSYYAHELRE